MLFYDFEVFKYNWLVVIIDTTTRKECVIWDDADALHDFHADNRSNIWVGYNSRHYDQYIHKGILCGFDPKKINDYIIKEGKQGWMFSSLLNKIQLINYDVMTEMKGLKQLEGFMGNSIRESSVPFDIDRPLTEAEKAETEKYCRHDVEQTIEVFIQRKAEFEASRELIKLFRLPLTSYSKTKAQLMSEICGGMGKKFTDNEFEFPIVPCLKLNKYKHVLNWYENPINHNYDKSYETEVAGVPHTFAWGGVHGANKKNAVSGILLNIDVTAYYPATQIQFKFGYRNMSKPENFELIHNENLRYKALGDKKARMPFKIADNSISGQLKDKNSKLYDPLMNNAVCVNGQLMLLMLIEMVESHAQLIQSNTDGILLKLNHIDDYDLIDDIVYEWECATGMKMEFELYTKIYQKDVNNYLIIDQDGKYKAKGAYVKKLDSLDYDLPIVNAAVREYLLQGIHPQQTINECNQLKEFQKIVKVSSKYSHALYGPIVTIMKIREEGKLKQVKVFSNGKVQKEKCFRVFASKNHTEGGIFKVKNSEKNPEQFANTPEHCFIENGDVNDVLVPDKLDKKWYIDMAVKRLKDFGVVI